MKFTDRFFKPKENMSKKAENLVTVASILATSSFIPTLDRFSVLSKVDLRQWDFIVLIAGVFMATTRLRNLRLKSDHEELLMDIVAKKLNERYPDGIQAFEDCKSLFEKEYDYLATLPEYQKNSHFIASDALGIWIVWNLLGQQPQSDKEINLVRVVGISVTSTFFNYWQS